MPDSGLYRSVKLCPLNVAIGSDTQIFRDDISYSTLNEQINKQLGRTDNGVIALEQSFGPWPSWKFPEKHAKVPHPQSVIHLVDCSNPFVIALLRTETEDRPLLIEPPERSKASGMTVMNILNSAVQKEGLTLKSGGMFGVFEDFTPGQPFDYEELKNNPNYPTVFYLLSMHSDAAFKFTTKSSITKSIPILFQATICDCEQLITDATKVSALTLQCIHISRALMHLIVSLVNSNLTGSAEIGKLEEIKRITDEFKSIMDNLTTNIQDAPLGLKTATLDEIFSSCCGDYPGAVAVRESYDTYKGMKLSDIQESLGIDEIRVEELSQLSATQPNFAMPIPGRDLRSSNVPVTLISSRSRKTAQYQSEVESYPRSQQTTTVNEGNRFYLSRFVPADESLQGQAQRRTLEQEARKASDRIDKRIRKEWKEQRGKAIIKILLLGQSESGKSTTLKNMQLYSAPQSLQQEAHGWRTIIHLNLLRSMRLVMEILSQENDENASRSTDELHGLLIKLSPLKQAEEVLRMKISFPQEDGGSQMVLMDSGEFSVRSVSDWMQAFNKMRRIAAYRGEPSFDMEPISILEACADDMIALWNNPASKQILEQRRIRLEESSGFFLDDIERIAKKDYLPTDRDILRARLRTVGMQEYKLSSNKGVDWYIYDVGSSRSQRSAWESFFEDANAIMFLVPLSCFDQYMPDDKHVNRVEDSLHLWKTTCSSKLLAKVPIILFLNKCDLLEKKLEAGIQLADFIPTFKDCPNNLESVTQRFKAKFTALHKEHSPSPRKLYPHMTSVTEPGSTAIVIKIVDNIILQDNMVSANML